MRYEPGQPWTIGHVRALDGLRGIAILLVLAGHWGLPGVPGVPSAGVTVFFVLSGFLITSLLIAEYRRSGTLSLRRFYGRRARRLLPALAALLLVVVGLDLLSGRADLITGRALPALFYVYNWLIVGGTSATGDPLGQTWSLSVEEQFYLLWPLLLLVCLRRGGTRVALGASLAVFAVSVVDRVVRTMVAPGESIYFGTDTNMLCLMAGCALALAAADGRLPRVRAGAVAVGVAMGALICATASHGPSPIYLIALPIGISAATAAAIGYAIATDRRSLLASRPLVYAGALSYSLYLWQGPLSIVSTYHPQQLPLAAAISLTVAAAVLSRHFVEQPFLRRVPRSAKAGAQAEPELRPAVAAVI